MAAVGNLNDYVKFQMAQGMEKGGGAGGVATELAVGLAMAQQMMQQQGLPARRPRRAGAAAAPPAPRSRTARAARRPPTSRKALGVPEADVMAIIESGELDGKKIGTVVPHQAQRARRVPREVRPHRIHR